MFKQEPPISYRPTRKAMGIIKRHKFQTSLNRFLNELVERIEDDDPILMDLEILELSKKESAAEEQLNVIRSERNILQAKRNMHSRRDNVVEDARKALAKKFAECVGERGARGEGAFRGWITGPANAHLIADCNFKSEDEAVAWCKGQEAKPN